MKIEKFIQKAIEGGWNSQGFSSDTWKGGTNFYQVLLDPKAWQAVGKVEKWTGFRSSPEKGASWSLYNLGAREDVLVDLSWIPEYQYKMHQMIDFLADGRSIEYFIKTL